jgi:nicotinamide riboside transporter PnuC|tara:strand:+ start:345 stop:551 length:207 start_codon:yes stop_codon:yes gene_type:complete
MIKATNIITVIALLIVIYNLTIVDWENPFVDQSIIAVIAIVSGLCCIMIMRILRISKKIQQLEKKKKN